MSKSSNSTALARKRFKSLQADYCKARAKDTRLHEEIEALFNDIAELIEMVEIGEARAKAAGITV